MPGHKDKGYEGIGMEGRIATWYAKNSSKDIAEFCSLADRFANETPGGSRILDVASGPGYLSIELAKRGRYEVTGLDISKTFVELAAENARQESVSVDFRVGNAAAMPFSEDAFELIVCRAAFKNFSQPIAAMNEMHRVLKTGGRAIILDLRKDASITDIDAYIKSADRGWLNSFIIRVAFRCLLIPRAYSREQFREMASSSRFGGCAVLESGIGFEIVLKK